MKDFLKFIKSTNQQFKCYLCTDESETLNLTVDIKNKLNEGANEYDLQYLSELIPENNKEILEFYKLYNGIKLFCNGNISGVDFCPICDIEHLNLEWKEWFMDFEDDDLYDFQKGGVAFGEVPGSGNYFIFYKGKVFYSNHDGGDDTSLGKSFNEFLTKIVTNSADFLYKLGCYTRYSDGKTDGQWIPKEFVTEKK